VSSDAANVDMQLLSWATNKGVMQQSVLPETSRVLYCTHPSYTKIGNPGTDNVSLVLQQCVLVHEHFHAILETGTCSNGQPAVGLTDAVAWEKGTLLNESLAAWMELHFVRQHGHLLGTPEEIDEVKSALWAYFSCGDYPAWPYAGAELIEALYSQQGISTVRSLIQRLRDDPANAWKEFNEMTALL
jgi:hypothetical protein